ncbi:MAG TPA: zinc ribbon domain-containing protein [Polyangia bacterium]|nr:zinc ribbon domain-containing protein [Polyangia bacterium]
MSTAKDQTLPAAAGEVDDADEAVASAPKAARRRIPSLVLGLGGAALTSLYGIAVMKMRLGAPLVMLGLGGLTLVLASVALWRVLDPLSRSNESAARVAGRAPQRMRELEREKQLVLKAIKEIELDYQMRKIAEGDYKEMVERYRRRAMRLISELEAGDNFKPLIERELRDRLAAEDAAGGGAQESSADPALPSAIVAGACGRCGTANDDDAEFCKKCGGKLKA